MNSQDDHTHDHTPTVLHIDVSKMSKGDLLDLLDEYRGLPKGTSRRRELFNDILFWLCVGALVIMVASFVIAHSISPA